MVTVHVLVSMQTSARGVEREGRKILFKLRDRRWRVESRESRVGGARAGQGADGDGSWIMDHGNDSETEGGRASAVRVVDGWASGRLGSD